MKPIVVADNKVPFLPQLFGDQVELISLPGASITRNDLLDADALITRTRTRCDAGLLDGTSVKCVATATIGTDHIDIPWCLDHGITVASAPGCNAPAVAQYVFASALRLTGARSPHRLTLGIVGCGHVGSLVARWGKSLGFRVIVNDPPRQEAEGPDGFSPLEKISAESDIITFHTPLTRTGSHPSFHLADSTFFESLRRCPVIINSARGPVTDTQALVHALDNQLISHAVIDCWEGEPDIDRTLLDKATYATPHIAGYSLQGKTRASIMAAQAVCKALNLVFNPSIPLPADAPSTVTACGIIDSYDPQQDTNILRLTPHLFESLRDNYKLRNEL